MNIFKYYRVNATTLSICVKNMELILELLEKMSKDNMTLLYEFLDDMSPDNMKKLFGLLESMTPESILKLFTDLKILEQQQITDMLNNYIELNKNPNSMAQLLELYSFIERTPNGDFLVHRYPKGITPFGQRGLLRNKKHKPETCSSVAALDIQVRNVSNQGVLKFPRDEEFKKVLEECKTSPPQIVTGGRRRRKTLKKKRGGNSKR